MVFTGLMGFLGRRKQARLRAMEDFRHLRRIATEDVTVLGEQLAELHVETLTDELDADALRHYRQALDGYERAKEALAAAEDVEQVSALDELLAEARFQQACVLARRDGEPLPERREPCFFNPQHGPSRTVTGWTPPGGVERQVEVCNACAQRLAGGLAVDQRLIRVGDRHVPWWQARGMASGGASRAHVHDGYAPMTAAHLAEATTRSVMSRSNITGGFGF